MRQIKFRKWREGVGMFYSGGVFLEEAVQFFDLLSPTDELMQFTGLKDKSGREIYEGDILSVLNPMHEPDNVCIVEWTDAGYVYEPVDGYGYFDISTIAWAMEMGYSFQYIGNIHENPELLGQN